MEARKMFEELNLEQIRNDDNYIEYVRNGLGGYISILFSLRWKSIKPTYGYQSRGINCHEITLDELKAIIQQAKELGWLEEKDEHFEEKQAIKSETNIEHYYECLSEVGLGGFALVNGRCTECLGTRCSECDFGGSDCCNKRLRWLASTYIEKYKLTQFEFDLLNTYKDSGMRKSIFNYSTLLGLQEKGYFKDIDTSIPIYEILENCEVIKND